MNSAAAARCGCDPAEGVFFGCPSTEGGPPFVGTWGEREPRWANPFARAPCREAFAVGSVPARGKSFRSCAVSGGFRRGERSCAGQTLSPVRRVGRPSPWGAFLRGANPFARAPCREAFAEGRVPARANPFARAPCREAFAEGRVPARANSFRLRAVSGGFC